MFNDTALLVPSRNSDELASVIIRILDNPDMGNETGEKGRRLVESSFTWQQHVERVLELYEEIQTRNEQ